MSLKKMVVSILALGSFIWACALFGSFAAMGAAYLLTRITSVDLFQASLIFIATAFTGVLAMGLISISESIKNMGDSSDEPWAWDGEDEDDDDEETESDSNTSPNPGLSFNHTTNRSKVGRNHPCPCGSDKKFKLCCINSDNMYQTKM